MSELPATIQESAAQYELEGDPNKWQLLARATKGVMTPANAIDAAAIFGAKYGIDHIDTPIGQAMTALSYAADMVDGKVARITGTQGPIGEAVDASGDKIKFAYATFRLWREGLVDKPLLTAVAVQNAANASLTIADRKLNQEPAIHPTKIGKRSFFVQELGIGINAAGHIIGNSKPKTKESLKLIGNVVGFTGFAIGIVATKGYFSTLQNSRKSARQPVNPTY